MELSTSHKLAELNMPIRLRWEVTSGFAEAQYEWKAVEYAVREYQACNLCYIGLQPRSLAAAGAPVGAGTTVAHPVGRQGLRAGVTGLDATPSRNPNPNPAPNPTPNPHPTLTLTLTR